MTPPTIRKGKPGDGPAAYALFYQAVHKGAAAFYEPKERAAWAPPCPAPDWEARLLSGHCIIGEDDSADMIGFMTLGKDGYLDFAYVAPAWMGKGVATAIYDEIERIARRENMAILSTEASYLAQRFLTRNGWQTDARQNVIRSSTTITNFRMSKALP
ncbi:GNAT family N-acetyltransferase [Actibacterium lipolyticum]|uniref:Putative N-acetyltransferase YafP n=1 Tax=Actibacterium lipolyticum TaxID=1524263 RepID=A0A238JTG2_9RHOB|nr:GNAT family N-acetyltransferase [Actibacterium lipolyticum]SMX33968.1 putative N-acetyltransferase YafP [Actibacterium lipolyticum]